MILVSVIYNTNNGTFLRLPICIPFNIECIEELLFMLRRTETSLKLIKHYLLSATVNQPIYKLPQQTTKRLTLLARNLPISKLNTKS